MTAPEVPEPGPRSSVLCSAWATPGDVPEVHRPKQSNEEWERWLMMASEILFMLSGRQWYGNGCIETARLSDACGCCGQQVEHPGGSVWYVPLRWNEARWRGHTAIKLPRSALTEVTAVLIAGEPFTAYDASLSSGLLRRADGCAWDLCGQELEVTYAHGSAPPESGVQAAVELAVELWLAVTNPDACSLPRGVQTVARQGLTIEMADPQTFLDQGRTGLYSVDLFLRAVNPLGRPQRGRFISFDVPHARR